MKTRYGNDGRRERKGGVVSFTAAFLMALACSGTDPEETEGDGTGSEPSEENGEEDENEANDELLGGELANPTPNLPDCVSEVAEGEGRPLDIYILFDQSGSMITPVEDGMTRLDAVRNATAEFLLDPKSSGIGVGLGYFGSMEIGKTSCDAADYREPSVPIGRLPDRAELLIDSLDSIAPTGETPTGPAITGACSYVEEWSAKNPSHATVILLVTDGVPEAPVSSMTRSCDPTLNEAIDAATACASSGSPVYVLGVGPSLGNLNDIAEAGLTETAYLVEGDEVATRVLAALNRIRDLAIPCEFLIPDPPEGETIDFNYFNVVYTERGEETATNIPYVESENECDSADGGWYFESNDAGEQIVLCGASCSLVSTGGRFQYAFGCERELGLR